MTLIVEDGTGTLAAESYVSTSAADTYHSNRGNTSWAALTATNKEIALRKATDYMVQAYRAKWKGYKVLSTQALDWPRQYVYLTGNEIYQNVTALSITLIPNEIKNACCELALRSLTDTFLLIDTEQQIVKEVIGPISTEYQPFANKYKQYTAVTAMLKPYFKLAGSSVYR